MSDFNILPGKPAPLGNCVTDHGTNFALFSANAQAVELCLFDETGSKETARLPITNRTGNVWHCFVPKLEAGQLYGFRVQGPYAPNEGHRFNPHKLLLDPYAKQLKGDFQLSDALFGYDCGHADADLSFDTRDSAPFMPKCVTGEAASPGKTGASPAIQWDQTVLYEAHVKGMTQQHPDVAERKKGTFDGLAAPNMIKHFKKLGVTTIELLPVQAFFSEPRLTEMGLTNYWGYNPISFFAPHGPYMGEGGAASFQKMVKAFHKAGIEVILDVVYNHTAESWELGPTLSFRGIDNASYYRLADDKRYYSNETGCGNALRLENPHVLMLAMDSLRYWIEVMGVDGFRFDLATTLARVDSAPNMEGPFLQALRQDPVLSRVKLIAEPWDIGNNGYQLGQFPDQFGEWNDHYRDTLRRFWRGERGVLPDLADALLGSARIFEQSSGDMSFRSVNFITSHDGFTLRDLVSFNDRHNHANGEENRDGHSHNHSNNCGYEGATDEIAVFERRRKRMRNLLATLFLSQGTPMLLGGDELGNSQDGNNNAYCQDNPTSWLTWNNNDYDCTDFIAQLGRLRAEHPVLRRPRFLHGLERSPEGLKDATWLKHDGRELQPHDWHDKNLATIGLMLCGSAGGFRGPDGQSLADETLLILLNNSLQHIEFSLPLLGEWKKLVDTSTETPPKQAIAGETLTIEPESLVLVASDGKGANKLFRADLIEQLAEHYGIAPGFHDLSGNYHAAGQRTKAALLRAMNVDIDSAEGLTDAAEQSAQEHARTLPATIVLRQDQTPSITIRLPADADAPSATWLLDLEDGTKHSATSGLVPLGQDEADRTLQEHAFELPADLPLGYHRLTVSEPVKASCFLIVTPAKARSLETEGKSWGLTVPLYGLTSKTNWGIGDYDDLGSIAEFAAQEGADFIGINPVHTLFPKAAAFRSPYSPSSRIFLNIMHIAPHLIPELRDNSDGQAFLAALFNSTEVQAARSSPYVDYEAVIKAKFMAFEEAYRHFEALPASHARRIAFEGYCQEKGAGLKNHALFDALCEHFFLQDPSLVQWHDWPAEYQHQSSDAVRTFAEENHNRVTFYCYLQWLADEQLEQAQTRARAAGMAIGLYLDLAVGVVPGGAETWSGYKSVATGVSLGAPPDAASPDGQNWSLAPLDPHRLKETGYRHFIETLRAIMSRSGLVRIDHILGINRSFWCPEEPDAEGAYVNYPLDDLIAIITLESERARCAVVGEDLGTVPEGLRPKLADANIYGCTLFYFERDENGRFLSPDEYRKGSLASLSNHDFPTLAGYWSGEDFKLRRELGIAADGERLAQEEAKRETDKEAILSLLATEGLFRGEDAAREPMNFNLRKALHTLLGRTAAQIATCQIEDLLGLADQPNVPGTTDEHPNWRRKIPVSLEELTNHHQALELLKAMREARQKSD